MIGIGKDTEDAIVAAISSPLLESYIEKARKIIFDVCSNSSLNLKDINSVAQIIYQRSNPDAQISFRATINEQLNGEAKITIIATDFMV